MHDRGFALGPNESCHSIIIDNAGMYFMKDDDVIAVFFAKIVS